MRVLFDWIGHQIVRGTAFMVCTCSIHPLIPDGALLCDVGAGLLHVKRLHACVISYLQALARVPQSQLEQHLPHEA